MLPALVLNLTVFSLSSSLEITQAEIPLQLWPE